MQDGSHITRWIYRLSQRNITVLHLIEEIANRGDDALRGIKILTTGPGVDGVRVSINPCDQYEIHHQPSALRSWQKTGAVKVRPCSGLISQAAWHGSLKAKLEIAEYSS